MNRSLYTIEELRQSRSELLRKAKIKMKESADPEERARNLATYKMLCRNRHFDATAGTCQRPDGLYYYPWE